MNNSEVNFLKRSYHQLINEAINILLQVKDKIKDDSDCVYTYYETPGDMRKEIDKYVQELKNGRTILLDEMYMHFLPTAAYQEHSMADDWTIAYHNLAERFDKVYIAIKNTTK
jgi:hypothetical protein